MGKLFDEVVQKAGWSDRQKEAFLAYYTSQYHSNYYLAAQKLGVTEERIRQLIRMAVHKLIKA